MTHDGRPSLLEPSRLEPVELDLRRVFLVGIALWVVALGVTTGLTVWGDLEGRMPWICALGLVLGGMALLWEHRRRRREAAQAELDAQDARRRQDAAQAQASDQGTDGA